MTHKFQTAIGRDLFAMFKDAHRPFAPGEFQQGFISPQQEPAVWGESTKPFYLATVSPQAVADELSRLERPRHIATPHEL